MNDSESTASDRPSDWLLDLPHRLDVAIDVVGPNFVPAVTAASTPSALTLRRALATDQTLRSALETVMRSRGSQPALVNGLQMMCFGLTTSGALVVARPVPDGGPTEESLRDLDAIGSWLLEPIESALTKPADVISVEPYRIASLRRILDEAAARGSARTVLGAFVEALGVWDELHGFGYAAAVNGTFVRYASPRGVTGEGIPVVIDGAAVPRADRVTRLSPEDRDQLHIDAGAEDVLVRPMKGAAELEWLLVFRGSVDEPERVRLRLYADILREALDKTVGTTCHRLVESIRQRPLAPEEPAEAAARAFVGKLMSSIDARQAAFAMVGTTGRQVFSVGETDLLDAVDDEPPAPHLVVTSSDADSLLTFVAMRSQPAFTMFERHIARIGVAAVQRWFQAYLRQSKEYERRERFRGVDTLFEELARDAVESGQHISMAVISLGPNVLRPGVLRAGVVKLRDHIRSCDFAGILSATEIAVLAPDVPPSQAALLSARLRQVLVSGEPDAGGGYPFVGVTTWSPERETPGSIVASARAALRPAV